jgi:DNA-binding MarR family transcriptional regulator
MAEDERDVPLQWLFHDMHKAHMHAARAILMKYGFKDPGQTRVLEALERYGKDGVFATQKQLADILRISPSTLTATLKYLEKQGYVEKQPDEKDLRRNHIALTPKGLETAHLIHDEMHSVDRAMFSGFSEQEQVVAADIFRRVIKNLRAYADAEKTGREGTDHS